MFAVLIGLAAGYYCLNASDLNRKVNQGYSYASTGYDTGSVTLSETGVSQSFTALDTYLNGFSVTLYDVDTETDAVIHITIADENGNELFHNTQTLEVLRFNSYSDSSRSTTVEFDDLNLPVEENSTYSLSISCTACTGDCPSVKTVENPTSPCLNNLSSFMTVDGITQQNRCVLMGSQSFYHYHNYAADVIAAVLILFAVILGILFLPEKIMHVITAAAVFAVPLFVFWSFETVTGNFSYITNQSVLGYTFLLLYLIYLLCISIGGIRIGGSLYLIVANLLSLADYFLYQMRGVHLSFADFESIGTAATVAGGYEYHLPPVYVIVTFLTCSVLILIWNSALKLKHKKKWILKGSGAVCSLTALALLISSFQPTIFNNWDPQLNYSSTGWLYASLGLASQSVDEPSHYSSAGAQSLLKSADAETLDNTTPVRLIVIMNESFADLSVLGELDTSEDELSFYHELEDNAEKGYLAVNVFGGGTADSEWEMLTGGSTRLLSSGASSPYTMLNSGQGLTNKSSMASALAEEGYETIFFHPYNGANYHRDTVLSKLGFDTCWFYGTEDDTDYDFLRSFPSDASDYEHLEQMLDDSSDEPIFIYNTTVQNHGGYNDAQNVDVDVHLENMDSQETDLYLSLIKQSDEDLEELIDYLKEDDTPTMLVFFGDHQPGLSSDFYTEMFGTDDPDDEILARKYMVPYLIWTNYDRETNDVPYMSLNYFSAYVMQEANMELTDFQKYQLNFMEQYPVLGYTGIYEADGTFTSYDDLSEEQESDLNEYQSVQYYWLADS